MLERREGRIFVLEDGDAFRFDQPAGTADRRMHEQPGNRFVAQLEYFSHGRIVGRVPQVDDHLGQVGGRGSRLGEQRLDVLEHPDGLSLDVLRRDDLAPVVDAGRARQQNVAPVAVADPDAALERDPVLVGRVQVVLRVQIDLLAGTQSFDGYWMVLTSVKSYGSYNAEYIPKFFTLSPTWQNYVDAFTTVSLGRYLWNTLFFTVVTTAIMLVVITLAAFAFARLNFAGKDLIFTLFLSLMMIPNELVVITNFTTITNLDLRNTFTGLILPSVTSVFYIYLLRENFAQIPDELYYAAKVDGTSDLRYLRKVMVPICKPTLITIVILKVIECWNSYVWPRLITDDPDYYLVSNGIQEIRENGFGRENIPAMMAAVVVISVPLVVLFLVFRKKVMAGVARGGTKG